MSTSRIIDSLFDLADAFVPVLGGPAGAAALAAAKQVVALIDTAKGFLPAADGTMLTVKRDELDALIATVNAHADRTIASLE